MYVRSIVLTLDGSWSHMLNQLNLRIIRVVICNSSIAVVVNMDRMALIVIITMKIIR